MNTCICFKGGAIFAPPFFGVFVPISCLNLSRFASVSAAHTHSSIPQRDFVAPRAPRLRPHPRPAPHACACAPRPATAPNFHKPPPQCLVSIVKAQEAGPISPRFRKRFVLCAKKLTPAYRLKRACIAPLFSCAPDALHAFPALLMNQNAGCPCAEALRV